MNPPPVLVHMPVNYGPAEVLIRHEEAGVEVDIRPAWTQHRWSPIRFFGGSFEVRSS
jgi:hypothetical protein